jgi:hypothetical protein
VLTDRDEPRAKPLGLIKLGLGLLFAAEMNVAHAAAAARQNRKRLERAFRAAKLVDQRTERGRPHILAADEPQQVQPLTAVEPRLTLGPSACLRQSASPRA